MGEQLVRCSSLLLLLIAFLWKLASAQAINANGEFMHWLYDCNKIHLYFLYAMQLALFNWS